MSERTQNINIVYKVNTVDVENAAKSLTKAKTANDALVSSSQRLGTEGSASANKFSGTIAGLTLQMQQLKAQIELTNQADKARLEQLRAQYSAMSQQLAQYQNQVAQVNTSTKSIADSLGGLYSAVRLALTAGLIKETITAGLEMARLAGQVEGVKRAFDKLPNSALLMGQLREATHGMVDELTLMQKALQAKNFGIPIEKLGMLLEFATVRAQQTGISVDYLVDSIVTGLGRNSIKILDNLQINIGELQKRMKETGKTMQVVAIEMIGEATKKMDGYIVTSETKVVRLETAWKNLKQTLSGIPATGGLIDWMREGIESIRRAMRGTAGAQADFAQEQGASRLGEFIKSGKSTDEEIERVKKLIEVNKEKLEIVQRDEAQEASSFRWSNKRLFQMQDEIKSRKDKLDVDTAYLELLKLYTPAEKESVETTKDNADAIKSETDAIKDREESFREWMKTRAEMDKEMDKIAEKLAKTLSKPKLAKGAVPEGGFQGPMTDNDKFLQELLNPKPYETYWERLKQGFTDMNAHIHKGSVQTAEQQRRTWERAAQQITNILSNATSELLTSLNESESKSFDAREKSTRNYYENQIAMAGDNSKAKEALKKKEDKALAALERQKAEAETRAARRQVIISTSIAIMQAFAEFPWPAAIAIAAALTIKGGVELGIINSAPKGYKKGVIGLKGPGTATSDSINLNASVGESIITAEATRESSKLLHLIQAKKINDKMIDRIIAEKGGSQQVFNDERLIKAIEKNKVPNLVRIGSMVFEEKRKSETSKTYVRSKYLG